MTATWRDVCEQIATRAYQWTGEIVDPRDVWTMDAGGEVWPIAVLYEWNERRDLALFHRLVSVGA